MGRANGRIFISWSLPLSRDVAGALKEWLGHVFVDVDSFMSDQDIDVGTLPMARVANELAESSCGILVVTRDNQDRQWINFEAGALYKELGSEVRRVVPLLVDIEPAELRGPMGLLQVCKLDAHELIDKLIPSLCAAFDVEKTARQEIGRAFLPGLLTQVDSSIDVSARDGGMQPDTQAMLAEVLSTMRSLTAGWLPSLDAGISGPNRLGSSRSVSVRLNDEVLSGLIRLSNATGVSMGDLMRGAIGRDIQGFVESQSLSSDSASVEVSRSSGWSEIGADTARADN